MVSIVCSCGGVIPDHKIKRVPGAVAIIRSSGDLLSELLRAAEDPGHKEWSAATHNFDRIKNTYNYPKAYITLAREAALKAYRLLEDTEAEEDDELLSDVFSLPKQTDEEIRPGGGKGNRRKRPTPPVVKADPATKIIKLVQTAGGFSVSPASSDSPAPHKIRIRAAYDVRSKNPFKQWEPEDFEFNKEPVNIDEQSGIKHLLCEGNRIVAEVTDPAFCIRVSGFDTERGDLIVEAKPEGRLHD